MPLFFPPSPSDGETWEDSCGSIWYYDKANNSWAKPVDDSVIKPSPFVRDLNTGLITPRVAGDDLDMTPGLIDISQYPDA